MVRNYSKPDYVAVGYVKQSDKKTKVNYTQIDNYEPHQDYIRVIVKWLIKF